MAGPPPSRARAMAELRRTSNRGDRCDLSFRVELVGVRPDALADVREGTMLTVALREQGQYATLVCLSPTKGELVGSLAAFPGIAALLACVRDGHRYGAQVENLAPTRCTVFVARA